MENNELLEKGFNIILNYNGCDSHINKITKPILKETVNIVISDFIETRSESMKLEDIAIDKSNKTLVLVCSRISESMIRNSHDNWLSLINEFNDFIYKQLGCKITNYRLMGMKNVSGYRLHIYLKY